MNVMGGSWRHTFNRLPFSIVAATVLCAVLFLAQIPLARPNAVFALLTAFALSAAWGIPIVSIACPRCPLDLRVAFTLTTGYAVAIFVAFAFGILGLENFYWLATWTFFGVWLFANRNRARDIPQVSVRTAAILGFILALSCLVVSPLMQPMKQASDGTFLDYTYQDNYFHIVHTHVLAQAIPAQINPELAGEPPVVYPDFQQAWMALLMRAAALDARTVYFQIAPLFLVTANVVVFYALGKRLTKERWGGYVAAALPYILFLPNPWDSNRLLQNIQVDLRTGYEMHFYDLRYNILVGAGWLLLTSLFLILIVWQEHQQDRFGIGLLTLASIMLIALIRVRAHYFVAAAPFFFGLLVWFVLKKKSVGSFVPLVTLAICALFVFVESTAPYYDTGSSRLAFEYGRFGTFLAQMLPPWLGTFVQIFPRVLQPFLYEIAWVVLLGFGAWLFLAFLGWVYLLARGQAQWNVPNVFLVTLLGMSVVSATIVVLGVNPGVHGDWGSQSFTLIPRLALLFAIVPLAKLIAAIGVRTWRQRNPLRLAALCLGLGALVSCRAAEATLHKLEWRAYPISAQEKHVYDWLRQNSPPRAVIASDPGHIVNSYGETIAETNFLSGQTERPAYLQRSRDPIVASPELIENRAHQLQAIFQARSPQQVKTALAQLPIDYLVVYAETPPAVDLTCCLVLILDGDTRLYYNPR